jgi:predicted DNA-binding protein (MmcQ/YjbR family)
MQAALIESNADHYFRPPYVGHRGWIGIYLDSEVPEDEVAGAIEDAFLVAAPKSLLRSQDLGGTG